MKKKTTGKRHARVICCMATAALLAFGLAACGEAEEDTTGSTGSTVQESTQPSQPESSQEPETQPQTESNETTEEESFFGQITALEGENITLALAEKPQIADFQPDMTDGKDTGAQDPAGEDESQKPAGEDGDVQEPAGENGEVQNPEREAGDAKQPEGGMPELNLTGETKVITVDEDTVYTINGEDGSFSDLKDGDTVTVTVKGDKVISIAAGAGLPVNP